MQLPWTDQPQKYVGLYVIDFGDQCAVGYTAEEVAVLLDSEEYAHVKVYKIHRAQPDGTMDLRGVTPARFNLESGMFFHCPDENSGRRHFQKLLADYDRQPPPCRSQLQLARRPDGTILIALIYPAECDDEMGSWLSDLEFNLPGPVDAGISQVSRFYAAQFEILQKQQLWPQKSRQNRSREELFASLGRALQR